MVRTKCWQDPSRWHRWYAWYPVWLQTVSRGDRICQTMVWRDYVERRREWYWNGDYGWEYRLPEELEK